MGTGSLYIYNSAVKFKYPLAPNFIAVLPLLIVVQLTDTPDTLVENEYVLTFKMSV
jgi:hypothetical protein